MLHNYRSGQFHRTSNDINQSSGFRDMGSAKSGPNLWQIWQVMVYGQAHMRQMGKWPWQCTTTGLDNSTELRMEKIRQAVTDICVPQVWQPPAHPPARNVTTMPLLSSPKGWEVKTGNAPNTPFEYNPNSDRIFTLPCWYSPHSFDCEFTLFWIYQSCSKAIISYSNGNELWSSNLTYMIKFASCGRWRNDHYDINLTTTYMILTIRENLS